VDAGDMVTFIGTCTGRLRAAGFTGIISTVETVGTFQQYPALCQSLESVVHANIHPYFNSGTSSGDAGSFVVSQRGILADLCGKSVIVSETGWPSAGGSNGAAIASFGDQQSAIASIKAATSDTGITWFSYSNDPWKPAGVEQNFGISLDLDLLTV
jgi:exo-beta-1,3-glucanase (GH17 family)